MATLFIDFSNTVHSMNGTRIGCGIIERAPTNRLLETRTSNLTASGVTSDVIVQTIDDTAVCATLVQLASWNLVWSRT